MSKLPQLPLLLLIVFLPLIRPIIFITQNQLWLELMVWVDPLLWIGGCMVGYLVLNLDQLLDVFVTNPKTNLATTVKNYFKQKNYIFGIRLLEANKHLQPKLTFRSALFQLVWVVLAIFTFTSTRGTFGKGCVMGLGARILLEQWEYYMTNRSLLKQWLFWQINREITLEELKWYLVGMTGVVGLLILTVKI